MNPIDEKIRRLAEENRQLVEEIESMLLARREDIGDLAEIKATLAELNRLLRFNNQVEMQSGQQVESAAADAGPDHGVADFDPDWYLDQNPDVRQLGLDPYQHYMEHGRNEGRHPLFDRDWYVLNYPDVAESGMAPLQHYLAFGKQERRHPAFDADWYLSLYPDIAEAGADPRQHYLLHGKQEGRFPAFDYEWYLDQYPDVAGAGINPREHYLLQGRLEGRFPVFDRDWYLSQYPDIATDGANPREHYVLFGRQEGRYPTFDRDWYLRNYPDVSDSGLSPLAHYLRIGKAEGRQPAHSGKDSAAKLMNYRKWVKAYDTLTDDLRAAMREKIRDFKIRPLISVLMPVYNVNPQWLEEAIESVRGQIYPDWELCIADDASTNPAIRPILERYAREDRRIRVVFREQNGHISAASNSALSLAGGEWIALLDHDDVLTEHALFWVADAINKQPESRLIYSDEDRIDGEGLQSEPYFKCDWNQDLFYSHNMICHLAAYKTEIVRAIGGFRTGFEGSQDYDLALRFIETIQARQIVHIPRVLYHWRVHVESTAQSFESKPYAVLAGERAINDHLQRMGVNARCELLDYVYRVRYALPEVLPLVSLVIPTRNGLAFLRQCITSILDKTDYANFEILIVDNGSDDPDTLAYMRGLAADPRIKVIRDDNPFNYSALNNRAVKLAKGEIVGLINNDIEVISPDWLSEMVSHALRPEVGAVGARLWYANDTLQHGGVIIGIGGVAGHSHKNLPRDQHGYCGRARLTQALSAVTAACLLIRKSVYEEVGGLNETDLQVAFNDVDFCLRVREAGYRNLWTPFAELYHHESATRGYEDTPEKLARFQTEIRYMQGRWGDGLKYDPAYSPNLSLEDEQFGFACPPRVTPP
ncbi:MAG: glycosyltransferase family 2 protein [Methylococcales bacterium]|nr:glycosyltransferase family 2 protein [Methylococcales bacterium]